MAARHVINAVSKNGKTRAGIQRTLRSPLVAVKMGMTSAWDENGAIHPITLLQVQQCQVVQVKTEDTDGYFAMQVGAGNKHPSRMTKAQLCHFQKNNALPKKRLFEFRVTEDALLPPGTELCARHFVPGQYVDVTGITMGKGFQGVMKRWGFGGQPASHGHSLSHRSPGSLGGLTHCGRVFKGKKMAGNMGNSQVTVMGLMVYHIDPLNNIIAIRGAVPGHVNNYVRVRDSIRLRHHQHNSKLGLPTPTVAEELEEGEAAAVQTVPTSFLKNPFLFKEE